MTQSKNVRSTPDETRTLLITAARLCLLEEGAAQASIKTIAARAGVNHGLIHRYFGSKEALMIAVQNDATHDLPELSFENVSDDADKIINAIFKESQVSIELISLSYHMPLLRKEMAAKTRRVVRDYAKQMPQLEPEKALRLGAEIIGLAVYYSIASTLPIKNALEAALLEFGNYPPQEKRLSRPKKGKTAVPASR